MNTLDPGPVSVMNIGFVARSSRTPAETGALEHALQKIVLQSAHTLKITTLDLRHAEGRCSFVLSGDTGAQILALLNLFVPRFRRFLKEQKEELQAGIDFGHVSATDSLPPDLKESGGDPWINAELLQQNAERDQILCTESFRKQFGDSFPDVFSAKLITLPGNDGQLKASEVLIPAAFNGLQLVMAHFAFQTPVPEPEAPGTPRKMLIVDDEEGSRTAIRLVFRDDFEVVMAESGQQAIQLFTPGDFSVVITDIRMAGMSGVELAFRIRQLDSEVGIIALTAYETTENAKQLFNMGASDYLEKPFRIQDLRQSVMHAIQSVIPPEAWREFAAACPDVGSAIFQCLHLGRKLRNAMLEKRTDDPVWPLVLHQARSIVADFVDNLTPGCDVAANLDAADKQFDSLFTLSKNTRHMTVDELQTGIAQVLDEQQAIHSDVTFNYSFNVNTTSSNLDSLLPVIAHIVWELVENAMSATAQPSPIHVVLDCPAGSPWFNIEVAGSGMGVPAHLESAVLAEDGTIQGDGRALGLGLLWEAVSKFNGRIRYEYRNGAVFKVSLPLN